MYLKSFEHTATTLKKKNWYLILPPGPRCLSRHSFQCRYPFMVCSSLALQLWGLPNHEAGKFRRVDAYAQILPGNCTGIHGATVRGESIDDLRKANFWKQSSKQGNLNLKILCKQYAKSIEIHLNPSPQPESHTDNLFYGTSSTRMHGKQSPRRKTTRTTMRRSATCDSRNMFVTRTTMRHG